MSASLPATPDLLITRFEACLAFVGDERSACAECGWLEPDHGEPEPGAAHEEGVERAVHALPVRGRASVRRPRRLAS